METISIKGKDYVTVNERVKHFRANYPEWSLTCEIVSHEGGVIVMRASVKDEKGVERASGLAYEKEDSSFINKTSYIENCETSAWGRALGCLGIGIDTAIATAEEVQNAVTQQNKTSVVIPITDEYDRMENCVNLAELSTVWKDVYKKHQQSTELKDLTAYKDMMKEKLS